MSLGSTTLTCTDHGTLAAAYEVYKQAHDHGLTPIIGLEAYVRDDDCPILLGMGVKKTDTVPHGTNKEEWRERYPGGTLIDYAKYFHLTMHAEDYDAYLTLVKLLSKADSRAEQHGQERKPLFDWSDIETIASKNVTIGSGCLIGMVQRHLMAHQNGDAAKAYFQRMLHLFGSKMYVEVFPHRCTHNFVRAVFLEVEGADGVQQTLKYYPKKTFKTDDAEEVKAADLAEQWPHKHTTLRGIKNNRTWDEFESPMKIISVKYVEDFIQNECVPKIAPDGDIQYGCNQYVRELARKHKIPVLISDDSHYSLPEEHAVQNVRLAQSGNWRFHNAYFRMSSDNAWDYFHKYMQIPQKEFEGWIDNSHGWASRFTNFKFDKSPRLPTKFYPEDALGYLRKLLAEHNRVPDDPVYRDRIEREIKTLNDGELLSYFFVGEEVVDFYKRLGVLVGYGRGSVGGLQLAHALGITGIDSIRHNLSTERFITDVRIASGALPDIDFDFADRTPLVGGEMNIVKFLDDSGVEHVVPRDLKLKTDRGLLTAAQAAEVGAEILKTI